MHLLPQIVHVAPLLRLDLHTVSVARQVLWVLRVLAPDPSGGSSLTENIPLSVRRSCAFSFCHKAQRSRRITTGGRCARRDKWTVRAA